MNLSSISPHVRVVPRKSNLTGQTAAANCPCACCKLWLPKICTEMAEGHKVPAPAAPSSVSAMGMGMVWNAVAAVEPIAVDGAASVAQHTFVHKGIESLTPAVYPCLVNVPTKAMRLLVLMSLVVRTTVYGPTARGKAAWLWLKASQHPDGSLGMIDLVDPLLPDPNAVRTAFPVPCAWTLSADERRPLVPFFLVIFRLTREFGIQATNLVSIQLVGVVSPAQSAGKAGEWRGLPPSNLSVLAHSSTHLRSNLPRKGERTIHRFHRTAARTSDTHLILAAKRKHSLYWASTGSGTHIMANGRRQSTSCFSTSSRIRRLRC